jgi:hypothetical protein
MGGWLVCGMEVGSAVGVGIRGRGREAHPLPSTSGRANEKNNKTNFFMTLSPVNLITSGDACHKVRRLDKSLRRVCVASKNLIDIDEVKE